MPEKQKKRINVPKYTLGEELINAISHGVGALFGIVALLLCIIKSASPLDGYKLASSITFGISVTLLYLMSCLYHALKVNRAKHVFRIIDHCTIFLLIAGSYTPFTLVSLRETGGWVIFGIIWGMTVLGITLNAVSLKRFAKISVACYLLMGWMIVFSFSNLQAALLWEAIQFLIYGGAAYTLGAVLYAIGAKRKYFHSVFHIFCLVGTVLHFFSIYLYVL